MKYFKYLLLILSFCIITNASNAQTVGYTYKSLAAEGCHVDYSLVKRSDSYYITVTVRSDRMTFLQESTVKFKTFDNEIVELTGTPINENTETGGIVYSGVIIPISEIRASAQFPITPAQIEKLKTGISRVRISLNPIDHERIFKKDKIGKKLYQFYIDKVRSDDGF